MEARDQDLAAVDETMAAETVTEGAIAPETAETAQSSAGPQAELEADAAESPAADAPAGAEADAGTPAQADASEDATPDAPLELVEMELALSLADIPAAGFDMALRAALASTGGTLLFIMPSGGGDTSVAALSLGSGDGRETFLAILGADGETVRFEKAAESSHPVAGLAASWTRVMERMPVAA